MYRESTPWPFITVFIINILLIGAIFYLYQQKIQLLSPLAVHQEKVETPLDAYAYDTLGTIPFTADEITFGEEIEEAGAYTTRMFYYQVEGKKVSGLAHLPVSAGDHPVIVMVRGFVDPAIYKPGIGTSRVSQELAKRGYITLAPDFLGYGESDLPGPLPLQDRFQTYPTIIQLLKNIEQLNNSLKQAAIETQADEEKIGIWAHSNGGQITLSVLEITGAEYPTVLWAPVSKPFPYSILYFTDEFEDDGRALRRVVYEFEETYDIHRFSLTHYFDQINAPLQIHQGGKDDAVPARWSDQLSARLTDLGKEVEYIVYPDADHNMQPDWTRATESTVEFFDKELEGEL